MAKVYYNKDCSLDVLQNRVICIIGYGNQGHAQAQNLRDSGCEVIVAEVKESPNWVNAEKAGFNVMTADEAADKATVFVMLAPDMLQPRIYSQSIERSMKPGCVMMFAHGFNIHYGQIIPLPFVDVVMVAPKTPGHMLRELYTQGKGAPALFAVYQDASGSAKDIALGYAKGLGCSRAGVLETTFAEETETDLFGEQAVLCGGVTSLIKAGFETLIEAGYQPELAYFEVLHELKLIIDLIYQGGISHMRHAVSYTARYGDLTRGPRVIDEMVKDEMLQILAEIQDGTFAREWILEGQANLPVFNALMKKDEQHQIELVGKELRKMMPWLNSDK